MAKGFESKSVADQQEQAADSTEERTPTSAHRRRLDLSRADIQCRLETAQAEGHRKMLRRALEALDKEIASLS